MSPRPDPGAFLNNVSTKAFGNMINSVDPVLLITNGNNNQLPLAIREKTLWTLKFSKERSNHES